MDNSSSLLPSSVLCHQCGQWQASFTQEKSACLTEVSVTEQIFQIPRNSGRTEHVQTVCTKLSFSAYAQEAHTEANYSS